MDTLIQATAHGVSKSINPAIEAAIIAAVVSFLIILIERLLSRRSTRLDRRRENVNRVFRSYIQAAKDGRADVEDGLPSGSSLHADALAFQLDSRGPEKYVTGWLKYWTRRYLEAIDGTWSLSPGKEQTAAAEEIDFIANTVVNTLRKWYEGDYRSLDFKFPSTNLVFASELPWLYGRVKARGLLSAAFLPSRMPLRYRAWHRLVDWLRKLTHVRPAWFWKFRMMKAPFPPSDRETAAVIRDLMDPNHKE